MDIEQLRSDWISLVSGNHIQVSNPHGRRDQSARVLEEMLPFIQGGGWRGTPLQTAPPAAESPAAALAVQQDDSAGVPALTILTLVRIIWHTADTSCMPRATYAHETTAIL